MATSCSNPNCSCQKEYNERQLAEDLNDERSRRDAEWVRAISVALGRDRNYNVPIVPDPELFGKLFEEIRSEQGTVRLVPSGCPDSGRCPVCDPPEDGPVTTDDLTLLRNELLREIAEACGLVGGIKGLAAELRKRVKK